MTVQECYKAMNADYEGVLRRLANEDRVKRFLLKFPNDESYKALNNAMEAKDCEAAFRASHTLKGICLNLAITALGDSSSVLTEALRGGQWNEDAEALFEKVREDYNRTIMAIKVLANS